MTASLLAAAVVGFAGSTLLLAEVRWFSRRSLLRRLAPYVPGAPRSEAPILGATSWRDLLSPLGVAAGDRLSRWAGAAEPASRRLRRIHSTVTPARFRLEQLSRTALAGALAAGGSAALPIPAAAAILVVLGGPALTFLLIEQRLAAASARHQARVVTELPVIAEQLGMLLGAGWSLGGAIRRLAVRGRGAVAADLGRIVMRVEQGVDLVTALGEWRELADIAAVDRIVSVLSLHHDTTDLPRLVAEEARALRRDAHRDLVETIETRTQQVWIPVTIAALVPGTLLMGVPFVDALTLFAST